MLHILKEIEIGFFPQIALFRRKYMDTQSFFVIDWYSLSQKKFESWFTYFTIQSTCIQKCQVNVVVLYLWIVWSKPNGFPRQVSQ